MRRVIIRRPVARRVRPAAIQQRAKLIDNETLRSFNPSILGLGDITLPARAVEAVSAVFDLAWFTSFCNQVDPYLGVPKFLSSFLDWLFAEIRKRLI